MMHCKEPLLFKEASCARELEGVLCPFGVVPCLTQAEFPTHICCQPQCAAFEKFEWLDAVHDGMGNVIREGTYVDGEKVYCCGCSLLPNGPNFFGIFPEEAVNA